MAASLRASARLRLRGPARTTLSFRSLSLSTQIWNKQPADLQLDPMTGELTALPNIDVKFLIDYLLKHGLFLMLRYGSVGEESGC